MLSEIKRNSSAIRPGRSFKRTKGLRAIKSSVQRSGLQLKQNKIK